MRRACLLAVALAALVLVGCGSDEETGTRLDTDQLQSIERLTPDEYAALDRALSAGVRFNQLSRAGRLRERARYDAAVTRLLRACSGLDGTDPLLREIFRSCAAEAAVLVPLLRVRNCSGPESCLTPITTARMRLGDVGPAYERHNRAVRATRLPPSCRRALLRQKADYAFVRKQRRVFQRLESAIRAGSQARIASALATQDRLDRGADQGARRNLRRFRARCR
jgi:hypothetical protein